MLIKNTNIPRLLFPVNQNTILTIDLQSFSTNGGVTATNFGSLNIFTVKNSPNFDILTNNNFAKLLTLQLIGTGVRDISDNVYGSLLSV